MHLHLDETSNHRAENPCRCSDLDTLGGVAVCVSMTIQVLSATLLVRGGKVIQRVLRSRLDGFAALLPVGWANLTMFVLQ